MQNQSNTTCVFYLPVQHATVIFKCEMEVRKLLASTATGVWWNCRLGWAPFPFLDITIGSDRCRMVAELCKTSRFWRCEGRCSKHVSCPLAWGFVLLHPSKGLAHSRSSITISWQRVFSSTLSGPKMSLSPYSGPGQNYSKLDANIVLEVRTTR